MLGASSDIGIEFIKQVYGQYSCIIAHYNRYAEALQALKNDIGDRIMLLQSDFSDEASAQTSDLIAFSDDFEEYEVGEPPNNEAYTIDQDGTSTLRVSDEEVHQGEQSLKFDDSEDGDGNMARLWIETRPLAKGSISFWINLADSGFFGIIGADDEDEELKMMKMKN